MKKIACLLWVCSFLSSVASGQKSKKSKTTEEDFLTEIANGACQCVDSISGAGKSQKEMAALVQKCIDDRVTAYQLGVKLFGVSEKIDKSKSSEPKNIDVTINTDQNSEEYAAYYNEIERYMMAHCTSLKDKIGSNNIINQNSVSRNREAIEWYDKGIAADKKDQYEKAIKCYTKAVGLDSNFAFAWDNMGLCYRKLEQYDLAIGAYLQSIRIDPQGLTALQNLAVAYQYTKEYEKSIETYKKMEAIDKYNPEIMYGIGQVYSLYLKDYEQGLDYMCKAYNMYSKIKSPFRTDAENIISMIYGEMKRQGKEDKFLSILKENNIESR